MKSFLPALLIAFLLSACQAGNVSPTPVPTNTPAPTETPAPTPTPEPSPTPTPETPEQVIVRLAETAHALGWDPNDETTWTIPEGTAEMADLDHFRAVQKDPNGYGEKKRGTDEALVRYDAFVTALRRADIRASFFGADGRMTAAGRLALADFAASGEASAAPGDAAFEDREAFETWLATLTRGDISSLSREWCNQTGKEFMPTHAELWTWQEQFDAGVKGKTVQHWIIVESKGGYHRPDGGFWSGMWLNGGRRNFVEDQGMHPTVISGHETEIAGNLFGDHYLFIDAALRLPYGRSGVLWKVTGSDGQAYRFAAVVVYADQPPLRGWFDYRVFEDFQHPETPERVRNESIAYTTANFRTRVRLNINRYDFRDLTREDILAAAKRNALAELFVRSSTFANSYNFASPDFFDEQTGLRIAGTSDKESPGGQSSIFFWE